MFSKLFVMLLAAYAINASVIISITEYDDSSEKDVALSSCDSRACNQLCLRFGFTGGVCIGDRCKCDNFKKFNDGVSSKPEVSQSNCDTNACMQLCRILGFKDGSCAGGKCKCNVFIEKNDQTKLVGTACDFTACDQLCRNLGYAEGWCFGDSCYCSYIKPLEENNDRRNSLQRDIENNHEENSNKDDDSSTQSFHKNCNSVDCSDLCQRLNYIRGICDGMMTCICY